MSTTVTSPNIVREGTLSALRSLTSRNSGGWPEPTLSVGRKIGKCGSKEFCWEAVGPAREVFAKIGPRIKEHLENGVETVSHWVTWSMYMIGKTPETASPTILFCCDVSAHRKLVRNVIKDSGILEKYPGIKTGHTSRPPDFNQLVRMAEVGGHQGPDLVIEGLVMPYSNACGMELIINAGSSDSFQSRSATAGGVVQLGERFFYFTAEHAFHFADEEDSYGGLSDSDNDSNFSIDEDIMSDVTEDDKEPDFARIGKLELCDANDGTQDNEPSSIAPLFPEKMKMKQERSLAVKETVQLSSVAISSRAYPTTNLDYNLIEVSKAAHQVANSVNYGGKEISIRNIVADGPKDAKVLAVTSRGIISGRISGTRMYTSLPAANTYQEVYFALLDCPLEIGDCGSWIIHANTGDLFGHIIAGSPETGAAMVIPALMTFNDLEDRLGIRPKLPMELIQPLPKYLLPDQHQTTQKEESSRPRQLTRHDIAWTKNVTAKFVDLMRQKHKQNIRSRSSEFPVVVQGSFKVDSSPPSYNQTMKDTMLRERYRRRFPLVPEPPAEGDREAQSFRNLLISLSWLPLRYEDHDLQELALTTMPLEEIFAQAEERESAYAEKAQRSGEKCPHWGFMDCSIIAMMDWFKNSYFTWVNNPPCSECRSATVANGMTRPTAEETALEAIQVELYRCSNLACLRYERFPRYKNPKTLMQTRRGRLGEWANCFGLFCRALGARVRWVWTATDHVFIEVYSESQRRWVHADPCENAFDKPGLYSEDWGKPLVYAIAFSVDGATDVTRRYVRSVSLFREHPRTRCSEEVLVYILRQITAMRRSSFDDDELARLKKEETREQKELGAYIVSRITSEFISRWGREAGSQSDGMKLRAEEAAEVEHQQPREA